MDVPQRLAVIRYRSALFEVREAGTHVLCAVTGRPIPLEDLRYWAVDRQEPYIDARAATEAYRRRDRR